VGSDDENTWVRILIGIGTLAVIVGAVYVSKRRRVSFGTNASEVVPNGTTASEAVVTSDVEVVEVVTVVAAEETASDEDELDALLERSAAPASAVKAPVKVAVKKPAKAVKAPVKAPTKAASKAPAKAVKAPAKTPVKAPAKKTTGTSTPRRPAPPS
jgi:hypothetical protein